MNPDIQERINKLIRLNQIQSVNEENRKYNQGSRKWWDTVNRITERRVKTNNLSLSIDPQLMNHHFLNINTDPHYSTPELLLIPKGTRIPVVDVSMVENFMMKQKSSAPGPDRIPYWIWRDYAQYLAPIITRILNFSLREYILFPRTILFPRKLCLNKKYILKLKKIIDDDQLAYKEGTSTTTALINI